MRLPLLPLAVLTAALLSPLSLSGSLAATPAAAAPARVIVTFKADAPLGRMQALASASRAEGAAQLSAERAGTLGKRLGVGLRGGRMVSWRQQVMFADGIAAADLVRRLAADSDVESVVVDERQHALAAPNDPLYAAGQPASPGPAVGQWYLRAPGAGATASINVEPAWAATAGLAQVVVAVLDTGVRFDHADLGRSGQGGSLLPGYDFISDVVTAGDGDGRDADPSDPGDFLTAAQKAANPDVFAGCDVTDSSWHGTETASLVSAVTGNAFGMASVGAAAVRVLPVRVLGKCGGYSSDIQAAMRWAAGLDVPGVPANPSKATVINLSLGSSGACDSSYAQVVGEVIATGTAIVASAGNSAGQAVGKPANCTGVIAVGGLRHVGTKVGYSDVGSAIALSAPGGNCVNLDGPCLYPIIAARNSGTTAPVAGSSVFSNGIDPSVGTSFSAPLVSATAALMVAVQPTLQPADLARLLKASARPFPTSGSDSTEPVPVCHAPGSDEQLECYCTTSTCGAGMLDAGAAVQAAIDGGPVAVDTGGGGGGSLEPTWLMVLLSAVVVVYARVARGATGLSRRRTSGR